MELKKEKLKIAITKQVETGEYKEMDNYVLELTEDEERAFRKMLCDTAPPEWKEIGQITHVIIMDEARHNGAFPVRIVEGNKP